MSARATLTASIDLAQLDRESIITFPHGLVGQPHWKHFVLLSDEDEQAVGVLQSIDDNQLSLMVTNPLLVLPGYRVELSADEQASLGLEQSQPPVVLTTVSIRDGLITTNLVGPLIINPRSRVALQVVLAESAYTTNHPIGWLSSEQDSK